MFGDDFTLTTAVTGVETALRGSRKMKMNANVSTARTNTFHICRCARITATVAVAALICSVLGCHDPARDNMEAMIKRAQKQSSPGELQAAVAGVCATNHSSDVEIQDLPREILALSEEKPADAILTGNETGKRTLTVIWGGAVNSWGIAVCPPGGHLDTNIVASVWRWSDGVFFFSGHE